MIVRVITIMMIQILLRVVMIMRLVNCSEDYTDDSTNCDIYTLRRIAMAGIIMRLR